MPTRRPSLWRQTPTLQRWWWFMPLAWWLSSSVLVAATQSAAQAFGAIDVESKAAEAALEAALFQLHRTSLWLCVAVAVACAGLWLVLGRARKRKIPLAARSLVRWVVSLAFLGALLLSQGAWRCQPPPPPYPVSAMTGIQFYLGIEQKLLLSLVMLWGIVGLFLVGAPLVDLLRCWVRHRRALRAAR